MPMDLLCRLQSENKRLKEENQLLRDVVVQMALCRPVYGIGAMSAAVDRAYKVVAGWGEGTWC